MKELDKLYEKQLLSILTTKEYFERYIKFIPSHVITDLTKELLINIEYYYTLEDSMDWDDFKSWLLLTKYDKAPKEKRELITTVIDSVKGVDVSSLVVKDILIKFNTLAMSGELADKANKVIDGDNTIKLSDFGDIMDSYREDLMDEIHESLEDSFVSDDLASIVATSSTKKGLEWRLEDLNRSVGPVGMGDLIVIGARPETGKTSFALSEVTHMVSQIPNGVCLFINNEEEGSKITLRSYCCALNKEDVYIISDTTRAVREMGKVMKTGKVRVWDRAHANTKELDELLEEIKPDIIVFNVLDKVKGFDKASNEPDRLRKLFQWGREKAKQYGPVFALAQADASAHGQAKVWDTQLYGSKTGIQGEADITICIGRELDPSCEDTRWIHVPKNKNSSGPRTDPKLKHGLFEVSFNQQTGRYTTKVFK